MSAPAARVAGWDLLRGLCALTVAVYHLLYWLDLATLPALGTYGVYLFFVLSGASLAYTYQPAQLAGPRQILSFLMARWLRLAPLYLLLCAVWIAMLSARNGAPVDHLGERLALNATFAFGLHDPATGALLVGGWSLGIEAVFYLAFPLLRLMAAQRFVRWPVLAALALLQAAWIGRTLGTVGWDAGSVAYHQVPAFAAYFFVGCLIGHQQRVRGTPDWPIAAAVLAWSLLALLLAWAMPERAGEELLGMHGAVLAPACMAVVWASGRARVVGRLDRVAMLSGDITYGTYLLHPILLWGVAWFLLPVDAMGPALRWTVLAGMLTASCALAWTSERWLERPLRRRGRALVRGPRVRHIDAASISS